MPLLARLLSFLVLAVAVAVVAFLAVVLAAVAATTLLVVFVLHKLGWDRRMAAYLMKMQGVQVRVWSSDMMKERQEADDLDAPIEARWSVVEDRRQG